MFYMIFPSGPRLATTTTKNTINTALIEKVLSPVQGDVMTN